MLVYSRVRALKLTGSIIQQYNLCRIASIANEKGLKQLHLDRLDVLLLHDPTAAELDQFLAPGGGMEAMVDLKQQGVVGELGG